MPVNIEDIYPLSPLQQGLLTHSLKSPRSGVYVQQLHCQIRHRLDIDAFIRAWREVIANHAVLRTSFIWEDVPETVQVVLREVDLPFELLDWTALSEQECNTRLSSFLKIEKTAGFNFGCAPLMRAALIRESAECHRFVWTYHHLLLDGWSTATLLHELFHAYDAILNSSTPEPRIARPFRDYITYLQQKKSASLDEAFWKEELEAFDEPTSLPERAGVSHDSENYLEESLALSREDTTVLHEFCRSQSITLNTLAHGTWTLLLAGYTGRSDVLFGTVLSGRPTDLAGVEESVGLFIQTIPFRAKVPAQETVERWLRELQQKQAQLLQHQWISLADVQAWSRINPPQLLFQSLLVFENYPIQEALHSFQERYGIDELHFSENTHYPLTLLVLPGDTLILRALFDEQKFERNDVTRVLAQFSLLLKELAKRPSGRLREISLLTDSDREQLHAWNETAKRNGLSGGVHHSFERQAELTPDAVAVVAARAVITYCTLNILADSASRQLRAAGVQPGSVVGLLMHRSLDAVAGILGILKSGAAYLPLDPSYPQQRLAFMLSDAGVKTILTSEECCHTVSDFSGDVVVLGEAPAGPGPSGSVQVSDEQLAYVLYTSGSTGQPKGVAMPHRALLNLLAWHSRELSIGPSQRVLQFAPLSFDVSFQEIFTTLCQGGTLVLSPEEARRDPEALWDFLCVHGIRRVFVPFVMLQQLAATAPNLDLRRSPLKEIITAGERLQITPAVRKLFEKLPKCRLINQYGPTETHVVSWFSLSGAVGEWPNLPPIGRPIDNVQIHILDSQQNPVPINIVGEIYAGGACVSSGYIGRPELTRERFFEQISEPLPARVYRTGDLARYREDGNIEFVGRKDQQVKIRGYRVELEEVEAQLSACPGIRDCAVVADTASGGTRLIACFTPVAGAEIEELRRHLFSRLPEYMIPAFFVGLESLPLTRSGKVDRRTLLTSARAELERRDTSKPQEIPRDLVQEMIAETWAQVLSVARVGIDDNFFALGGHSLLATQVVSRLRSAFHVPISIRSLFEFPTVRRLAEQVLRIKDGESRSLSSISKRTSTGDPPLSFSQERMWFFDHLAPGTSDYNIALRLRVSGYFRLEIAERALNEIIRRHEVLRTRYHSAEGKPICRIVEDARIQITVTDLQDSLHSETEVEKLALMEARKGFDLGKELPLRVAAIRLSERELVLLLTLHHIAFDGWSLGVLAEEFSDLYAAHSRGDASPLPELSLQYSDFAEWQRELVEGEFEREQLEFWRSTLMGVPLELDLPFDHPRSAILTNTSSARCFSLGAKLSEALKTFSRQAAVTPFMTLLAGFYALLHRYTQQKTIVIGTPLANRHHLETEQLIGCFINPLPLRCDLSLDTTFFQLLMRVRETALGAYSHQDLPFERIVQEHAPERDLSRTPLFQVMFIFQNFNIKMPELSGVRFRAESVDTCNAIFDLTLTMWESEGELAGLMEYNSSLFEPETIENLIEHYRKLLDSALTNSEQPIGDLRMLTGAEWARAVIEWNQTEQGGADACVHRTFEEQAIKTPNAVAIVSSKNSMTYSDLNRRSDALANYLGRCEVGPEKVVGLCVERSIDAIVGMLGILKAGGAFLPLDPALPRARLEFMLNDAAVSTVLTQSRFAHLLNERFESICLDREWLVTKHESSSSPRSEASLQNLAYLIYTSGSTGVPKGVMIEHSALANYVEAAYELYDISASDRVLQFAPLWFDAAVEEIFPALARGATIVVRDNGAPEGIPDFISRCETSGITVLTLPTAYWREWAAEMEELPTPVPDSLRLVILGGEKVSAADAVAWRSRVPARVRLLNTYGPTEATVIATCCEIGATWDGSSVPIGRPLRNTKVYVLDERLNPLPIGAKGELCIGGKGVARGYLNRPELTARQFVRNPFSRSGGDRLYRTGDFGHYKEDGHLEFLGRADDQVKLRGHRIELGEIESALEQHPLVAEAVALVRHERLLAYVASRNGASFQGREVLDFIRSKLPQYMLPAEINIIPALPRTAAGKVDRAALAALPTGPRERLSEAPGSELEKSLCRIWQELLQLDEVGIHDNFFELGGHSMLALQLVARVHREFQIDLPARVFFEKPTIAGLACEVERLELGISAASPVIDFEKEAILDPAVQPASAIGKSDGLEKVFLTGATGFLGTFLLAEILSHTHAEVHCLVRPVSLLNPVERIHDSLRSFSLWQDEFKERIVAVQGDLGKPRFGLNEDEFLRLTVGMDTVYHSGALVHAALPYDLLKAPNVGGTEEAIRLASLARRKPLHLISTLSVFFSGGDPPEGIEEDTRPHNYAPMGGYGQSKWIAERLTETARARGLECVIYRPGRIMGEQATDLTGELLRACLQIGSIPDMEFMVDVTPVDYVAKAIFYISCQPSSRGKTYHLNHPEPIPWSAVTKMLPALGLTLEVVPPGVWRQGLRRLLQSDERFAQLSALLDGDFWSAHSRTQSPAPAVSCKNTLQALAASGIRCPKLDVAFVRRYLAGQSSAEQAWSHAASGRS